MEMCSLVQRIFVYLEVIIVRVMTGIGYVVKLCRMSD